MSIDVEALLASPPGTASTGWVEDDVILYHLALGAGSSPTEPRELEYVLEDRLKVLPTYAVLQLFPLVLEGLVGSPALDVDLTRVLHAGQEIEVLRPVPSAGSVRVSGRFTHVHDKGSGALLVHESTMTDGDGREIVRSRATSFASGEGGFGGDRGPREDFDLPSTPSDLELTRPTLPGQALLYRLTGDRNPLHSDPGVATASGFDRPILHGLCTYGMVAKAVIDECLDGDVTRMAGYRAKFTGVVHPGDVLTIRAWLLDQRVVLDVSVAERDAQVMRANMTTTPAEAAHLSTTAHSEKEMSRSRDDT